jgi:multidrug efflux pump subunit AcrA (membrane-fusion protein)
LSAVASVEVRARVSGYLESTHFTEGAEVKEGDLLFVVDPAPLRG